MNVNQLKVSRRKNIQLLRSLTSSGSYLHSSLVALLWLMAKACAQVLLVFMMARELGPENYGVIVATIAIANFFVPIAGLGLHGVLLTELSGKPEAASELIPSIIKIWSYSAFISGGVAVLAAITFLPLSYATSIIVIALLVYSEIISGSLTEIAARIAQSRREMHGYGQIMASLAIIRLIALITYTTFFTPQVQVWIVIYSVTGLFFSGYLLLRLVSTYKKTNEVETRSLILKGVPFSIGGVALRIQAEFNKPALAQLGFEHAANFNIAQRALDIVNLPLLALQETLWPRLYAGHDEKKIYAACSALLVLALLLGLGLALLAPIIISKALGAKYANAANLLVALAGIPALQVGKSILNAYGVALGHRTALANIYIANAIICVCLTIILISKMGLTGAVITYYINEILTILFMLRVVKG